MRLEDLRKRLTEMSEEERRQFILKTRADRRVRKEPVKQKKATERKAASKADKIAALLGSMTPEEAAQFMKQVGADE